MQTSDHPCGHALFDACSSGDACARRCSRQLQAEARQIALPMREHILATRGVMLAAALATFSSLALCWAVAPSAFAEVARLEIRQ